MVVGIARIAPGPFLQLGPGASSLACGFSSWRPDCVAGHVRFELRNVAKNYLFERSHKFPGIQPNSGRRDYSRLSCSVAETQQLALSMERGGTTAARPPDTRMASPGIAAGCFDGSCPWLIL
jgi:hypothetical protein